ncbi:MAG: hypothetical protein HOP04_11945 [Methylophilaceae bacterium]|nr:hypothetical protein [Methylophilaceae bacterium]
MARSYTLFLNHDQIPDLGTLQAAIKTLAFRLVMDDSYVPLQSAGYLPCTLDGEDAGVTIRFDESNKIVGKDTAITLQWSGDPREQVCATIIAATLAHSFAATVRFQNQQEASAETLIADARKQFSNLD